MCEKMNKYIFLKRYVCQLSVATKTRKHIPLLCIFGTNHFVEIAYLAIRWQSWQTWFKTKKLTNIPPPQPWGAH